MQLKQLKLVGFKSFVDPTIIPFPSQLVAVVGPNGCGKSNVIDAVKWVMGESSAKNLRGESMADVIFNGSSNRKALGQASVELVFDNSLGRLAGQYASYQEISVKRVVTRDGESSYFLNGARCRRRDITDIFLGTGAGTKGYSIIGQGTISRLVEARPEELRAFLEEAAGVSKYKERRRETVTRIAHTRENLARICDIRNELDKQLQRLEKQAKAAERYQVLKREERLYKAEILALKWQSFHEEEKALEQLLQANMIQYESLQTDITEAYKKTTLLRETHQQENQQLHDVQARFYQLGTEIALLEENIQQQHKEKQRLISEQQQLQTEWQTLNTELSEDTQTLQTSETEWQQISLTFELLQKELLDKESAFQSTENKQSAWQEALTLCQTTLGNAVKDEQVASLNLTHLKQKRSDILVRLEKIQEERLRIEQEISAFSIGPQEELLVTALAEKEVLDVRLADLQMLEASLRTQLNDTESSLRRQQDAFQKVNIAYSTLEAQLKTAISKGEQPLTMPPEWSNYRRLIDLISVDETWQKAVEWVLGENLSSMVVESLSPIWPTVNEAIQGDWAFTTEQKVSESTSRYPRLLDKVAGFSPSIIPGFDKVYAANGLEEAYLWLPTLLTGESIITPCCFWLSKDWLKVYRLQDVSADSLLVKQRQLQQLRSELTIAEETLFELTARRDALSEQLQVTHEQVIQAQGEQSNLAEKIRVIETKISTETRLSEQFKSNQLRLVDEHGALSMSLEDIASDQHRLEGVLEQAIALRTQEEAKKNQLLAEKTAWEDSLRIEKQALLDTRQALHQQELKREREQLKIKQLQQNITRINSRLDILTERLETLAKQTMTLDTPDASLQESLKESLAHHQETEARLTQHRAILDMIKQSLDEEETHAKEKEKQSKHLQDVIQQQQLQVQSLTVHESNVLEAIRSLDTNLNDLLTSIPAGITITIRESELQAAAEKISRLGAINLAAIDEYQAENQRKEYLDEQVNDLTEALNTLDAAIEKMDKETRQRLQQTFDEVNEAFQALFPRLFGGGRAMLTLTCDNLLEAGIMVMAQPPGKRNSTIHLLSGGEKAMTAVALVFAIFQLNPSPFCMLDEVDAPLDDVNVGRFCSLVKEMSCFVQFLVITHNKIAMESADQLIGVTMREPGVSRIVAVDVEQALAMTESS